MTSGRQALITDVFKSTKLQVNSNKSVKSKSETDEVTKEHESGNEDLQSDLDTLRAFDLNQEFGPCIGITRLERWIRAQKLGLNPPMNVRKLVEYHILDKKYTECVWTEYNI